MNAEPVVNVRIVITTIKAGVILPDWLRLQVLAMCRLDDANTIVSNACTGYLARPSSPPSATSPGKGTPTVINCKMIDEVMYGMMPSAKIVTRRKLPPLKIEMPRTEPPPAP